jgi:hypothetical protein
VRMSPERSAEDFIELSLDTERDAPALVVLSSRGRGRRAVTTERILGEGPTIAQLTDEDVITALLEELLPFIER